MSDPFRTCAKHANHGRLYRIADLAEVVECYLCEEQYTAGLNADLTKGGLGKKGRRGVSRVAYQCYPVTGDGGLEELIQGKPTHVKAASPSQPIHDGVHGGGRRVVLDLEDEGVLQMWRR